MSNLRPEPRVDKHGRTVIRHVRIDQTSRASGSLPMPQGGFQSRPATPHLKEAIAMAVNARTVVGAQDFPFTIDDIDPDAVQEIERLLQADRDQRPPTYSTENGVSNAITASSLEECVRKMHNTAVFGAIISGPQNFAVTPYVNGLDQYPGLLEPNQDYIVDVPQDQVERAQHLVHFTVQASNRADFLIYDSFMETFDSESGVSEVFTKLKDDELAAYIFEHPEHSEDILSMIEEAGHPLDVQLLDDRLNHSVQSLRDGLL